ncbi:hypothetical protein JCM15519_20170 [Fundidesulfovibrio butyratiphilus]
MFKRFSARFSFESVMLFCVALLLGAALVWALTAGHAPSQAAYAKYAKELELVSDMRAALSGQALAATNAALSSDDADAVRFAGQVKDLGNRLETERADLAGLFDSERQSAEAAQLGDFTQAWRVLESTYQALADLTGRNTNAKAYGLAYGPAAKALADFDLASASLARGHDKDACDATTALILTARLSLYRILALLPPHIAEADPGAMDALEASMGKAREQARVALDELAARPGANDDPNMAKLRQAYDDFFRLTARIVPLSRENTNVRSLEILLGQKRNALAVCQDSLKSLERTLRERQYKAWR